MSTTDRSTQAVILTRPDQIALFQLAAVIKDAEIYVKYGHHMARNFWTCRMIRQKYNLTGRTYKELIPQMKELYRERLEEVQHENGRQQHA